MRLFDIKFEKNNNEIDILSCAEKNLKNYQQILLDKGWKIIAIEEKPEPKKEPKKINKDSIEKRDYYYSKYRTEKRRLDTKAITKVEFKNRVLLLKELRRECKTKSEFQTKYEEVYK